METIVKARLIKIGNSQGIRIPKAWLDQLHFGEEVELVVQPDQLVIRSPHHPRQGWEGQFAAMGSMKDDTLLDAEVSTRWDNEEWEW
jgi:antitoxin MazE